MGDGDAVRVCGGSLCGVGVGYQNKSRNGPTYLRGLEHRNDEGAEAHGPQRGGGGAGEGPCVSSGVG